jgi:formyltetrahydrofolate-dependent phosphoribosylglycinamide formyltransferase
LWHLSESLCHVFVSDIFSRLSLKKSPVVSASFLHICNMFQKLRLKWKVNGKDLLLILITFAVGGSVCGMVAKKMLGYLDIDKGLTWFLLYIIILTLIWPFCVLIISIPMGQFVFFQKYINKIFVRMSGKRGAGKGKWREGIGGETAGREDLITNNKQKTASTRQVEGAYINVAIFASGAGSNAEKIIQHFKHSPHVKIVLIVCNKPGAGVLQVARQNNIDTLIIERERFNTGDAYVTTLKKYDIRWIILAGFLWKLPSAIIHEWPSRIINIHPALLPKYGGKGMYGQHVHQAVINAGDKESGISIHYVDEIYDHGEVIMQARCEILKDDTPESLAEKIHSLEHVHFPKVIEGEILKAKS